MNFSDDLSSAPFSHKWFPDTCATNHATPNVTALSGFEEYSGGDTLRVGNGSGLHISHVGHTLIPSSSRTLHMSDVLHVPGLSASLLSIQCFRLIITSF